MPFTDGEKEVAAFVEKFKDEIAALAKENLQAIVSLEKMQQMFVRKPWYEKYLSPLISFLTLIFVLAIASLAFKYSGAQKLQIGDYLLISKQVECVK